jgi:AmmeMemoRadiSam system protein B
MAGPRESPSTAPGERPPVFAGRFYPDDAVECRQAAESYVTGAAGTTQRWLGGIVPHAGWICSGAIAGQTIAAISAGGAPDVVVVFGAIHTPMPIAHAALDSHRRWLAPGGESVLPESVQAGLLEAADLFVVDERFHRQEHAVEVELPLIQARWPSVLVLPVEVPAVESAVEIGRKTAQRIKQLGLRGVYLASSDLTHYGPAYHFTPSGIGPAALEWAKENDRRILRLVTDMQPDRVVSEAKSRLNACGSGAIAAMLSACREDGATGGQVLRHANSVETLAATAPQPPTNAVGYAAVVIG